MGRDAAKARGNVWYEARIEASKRDDRLASREGAAEQLGMSVDAIRNAELSLDKCMPVEKAVLMAHLYNAPQLLNYFCLHGCPIGHDRPLSEDVPDIDRIAVKFLAETQEKRVIDAREKLLSIAENSEISEEEIGTLTEILTYLETFAVIGCELRSVIEIRRGEQNAGKRKARPVSPGTLRDRNQRRTG